MAVRFFFQYKRADNHCEEAQTSHTTAVLFEGHLTLTRLVQKQIDFLILPIDASNPAPTCSKQRHMKVLTPLKQPPNWLLFGCKNQTLQVFKAALGGKLSALNLVGCDAETLARNIKRVLLLTAQEVSVRAGRNNSPGSRTSKPAGLPVFQEEV